MFFKYIYWIDPLKKERNGHRDCVHDGTGGRKEITHNHQFLEAAGFLPSFEARWKLFGGGWRKELKLTKQQRLRSGRILSGVVYTPPTFRLRSSRSLSGVVYTPPTFRLRICRNLSGVVYTFLCSQFTNLRRIPSKLRVFMELKLAG